MAFAPAALWRGNTEITSSFGYKEFRSLWVSGACAGVAQWTLLTARAAVAHKLGGGSGSVGLVVFAAMVPFVIVPPFAGVVVDRFNRRTVTQASQAVSLLAALAMAVLALSGVVQVWHLFALSLVDGAARSVAVPATQAMVPGLVPEARLLNAIALQGIVTHGSRLIGPLITLVLLDPFGAGWTFVAAALLYGGSIIQLRNVPQVAQVQPHKESPLHSLAEGIRYSVREPVVRAIFLLVVLHCGLTMSYDALMPDYAKGVIGRGENGYSILMFCVGVGSFGGTVLLAGVSGKWHRGRMLLIAGLLSGLSPVLLAVATYWGPALLFGVLLGSSQALFMALTNAALQSSTPDRYRGRVLSLFLMLGGGIMAFANLWSGYLGDAFGVSRVLFVPALIFAAFILASTFGGTLRAIYRRTTMPAVAH